MSLLHLARLPAAAVEVFSKSTISTGRFRQVRAATLAAALQNELRWTRLGAEERRRQQDALVRLEMQRLLKWDRLVDLEGAGSLGGLRSPPDR